MTASARAAGLLQYPRALLVAPPVTSAVHPSQLHGGGGGAFASTDLSARRWVRKGSELCVEGMFRSRRLLTEYVAKFKFADPQWRDMLMLPCGNPVALELKARHCNYALKHIVQKGHAVYATTHTQHSVLHPMGLAERAHVTCAFGTKGERLVTNIIHEGPLHIHDLSGPRGVVAVSQVQGFGTCFQRKPMLWQRSRRVGALQSHMGAYDWTLWHPDAVGRASPAEVLLLQPHTTFIGGGASSMGIVSSISMAAHPFHFVGEFDAPMTCAVDAVHQLARLTAARSQLVRSAAADGGITATYSAAPATRTKKASRSGAASSLPPPPPPQPVEEPLHCVAWSTQSPKPFLPLELDLPFRMIMSRPNVFAGRHEIPNASVGRPFVGGVPLVMMESSMTQGEEHYVFDDSVAARPFKFWSQRNSRVLDGEYWFVRDGHLPNLSIVEHLPNPFAPDAMVGGVTPNGARSTAASTPLHAMVKPTAKAAARLARYQRSAAKAKK